MTISPQLHELNIMRSHLHSHCLHSLPYIWRFQGRSLPLHFAYFRKTCNTFVSVIRKPIRKSQHGNTRLVLSISKTSFLN